MNRQGASLHDTFETLHAVLRGAKPPESAEVALGLDASRVAFYADTVFSHVQEIVRKNFAVLAEVLGQETFDALVQEYFALYPAEAFELNENAASFRELLASHVADGRFGLTEAHLELAELEWQEFVAYVSPVEIPKRRWLTEPALNPTLGILQLDYPVAAFLDAWRGWDGQGAAPPFPTEPAPETIFVLRHPDTESAIFLMATDQMLFAFKVIHDGVSIPQAALAAGVSEEIARAAIQEASQWGLLLLPEMPARDPRPERTGRLSQERGEQP